MHADQRDREVGRIAGTGVRHPISGLNVERDDAHGGSISSRLATVTYEMFLEMTDSVGPAFERYVGEECYLFFG